jgi:simple sugar transport system permease protein
MRPARSPARRRTEAAMLEASIASTIAMAAPLLFAALGELLVEESGVINIGIEGAMLVGAFFALAAAYFTHSLALGLLAGIAAAVALNALLALLVVNLAVNQVVAGTALDILALGITGVFYRRIFGVTGRAFTVRTLGPVALGPLARLPLVGRALFDHDLLVYFAFALVPAVAFVIARTRYGLRLRAAGERPEAADALGLGVYRLRWQALIASGVLTGLGGAFLTLAYTGTFVEGITAGRGFVALAVVILGRWNAWGCAAASVLFGAAMALQFGLQALGTAVPYQVFLALPYALTLVVLAGFSGQAQAPSALGEPYVG